MRRQERSRLLEMVLIVGVSMLACDSGQPDATGTPAQDDSPAEVEVDEDVLERLRAIGYVAGTTPASELTGVSHLDSERAQPGANFYTSGHLSGALLIDMQGNLLHRWQADFETLFPDHPDRKQGDEFWRHAQLLEDGSVLGIWETYGIFKLDRNSNLIWTRPNRAHHDLHVTTNGDIYHLAFERTTLPELGDQEVVDDFIVSLSPDGEELQRWSMAKLLKNADWPELRSEFWKREANRRSHLTPAALSDPFHTNALVLLSAAEAGLMGEPFRAGDVLVSMCLLDTIAVVALDTGETRWWQTGPFALQHYPRVTAEGGIVLFNNHVSSSRSSAQIIDPRSGELIWEYGGSEDDPLFSRTSASAEELPNGNILIVESDQGRILEVTRDKQIVWEFRNPSRVGRRRELAASIFHADRIPVTSLRWLKGR